MFKKLISMISIVSLFGLNIVPAMAECRTIEHLDVHKKAPCNEVIITGVQRTVEKGNVLEFAFSEKFYSKKHQAGELVNFTVPQALYTKEGTLLLPSGTTIVAEITKIQKAKVFNKNARVSLCFRKIVLPDNTCIDIKAVPFTKDSTLKEGPWVTFGKVLVSTLSLGIIGTGAGVGFAFIPSPAKIGLGIGVGVAVGCGVGLLVGLITPGCNYKAKKGEVVYALLIDEFSVCGCGK